MTSFLEGWPEVEVLVKLSDVLRMTRLTLVLSLMAKLAVVFGRLFLLALVGKDSASRFLCCSLLDVLLWFKPLSVS